MEEQGGTNQLSKSEISAKDDAKEAKGDQNESMLARTQKSIASFMPSLNIIRSHVINPLLVATERVVEQYIPV